MSTIHCTCHRATKVNNFLFVDDPIVDEFAPDDEEQGCVQIGQLKLI